MNQNQRYETCYQVPRLRYHLGIGSKKENKVDALSNNEQRLYKILSETKSETLIGISIRERLSSGSIRGFREMIKELKQQYADCGRERMIEVFGIDAVKLIEVLCK